MMNDATKLQQKKTRKKNHKAPLPSKGLGWMALSHVGPYAAKRSGASEPPQEIPLNPKRGL
jgi:hypothetical protein